MSSAFDLFVSFVVKQSCTSARVLALHPFPLSCPLETKSLFFEKGSHFAGLNRMNTMSPSCTS